MAFGNMFYFEAQRGLTWEELPSSNNNFYIYVLRNSARKFIAEGVAAATVGADGFLVYPDGFLQTLAEYEDSTDRLLAGGKRLGMPVPDRAQ